MLLRFPIAFVFGLVIYLLAMSMTTYEGMLSLLLQPVIGSILTFITLVCLAVVGLPLLLPRLWIPWQRNWWIALLLFFLALLMMLVSIHPALRITVVHPETGQLVQSVSALAPIGWLLALFAILYFPKIGLYGDRRWM